MIKAKINKVVQGAWITRDDAALLADEAKKAGFRTGTAISSYILEDYCRELRIKRATAILASSKKRGKNEKRKGRSRSR